MNLTRRFALLLVGSLAGCATESDPDRCVAGPDPAIGSGTVAEDLWTSDAIPAARTAPSGFERLVDRGISTGPIAGAITMHARYPVDDEATVFAAVPGALVSGVSCVAGNGDVIPWPDQRTAADGSFQIDCPASHPEARGSVTLSGPAAAVSIGTGDPVSVTFGGGSEPIFPRGAGRAFAAAGYVAPIAAARFGQSRPQVRIVVDAPGAGNTAGRYLTGADRIEFGRGALETFSGEEAFFRVAHEYGHAYHYVAIEPWGNYQCVGDTHAFHVPNTLSCAFVEGFAHFFAAWIGGARLDGDEATPNYGSDRVFEENLYRTYRVDGARTPGVVAAFLYDLADDAESPDGPGNTANGEESFDQLAVPGGELARIMRQCRLTSATAGCPAIAALDGIDQLVYCGEGVAGPGIGVRWRLYQSVENGGGAAPWNPPFLRSLWQHDLYPIE